MHQQLLVFLRYYSGVASAAALYAVHSVQWKGSSSGTELHAAPVHAAASFPALVLLRCYCCGYLAGNACSRCCCACWGGAAAMPLHSVLKQLLPMPGITSLHYCSGASSSCAWVRQSKGRRSAAELNAAAPFAACGWCCCCCCSVMSLWSSASAVVVHDRGRQHRCHGIQ